MTIEEMAEELRRSGWRVQPPLTQENCPHERRIGSGAMSADGSGYSEWRCPSCGKSDRQTYGPSIKRNPLETVLMN